MDLRAQDHEVCVSNSRLPRLTLAREPDSFLFGARLTGQRIRLVALFCEPAVVPHWLMKLALG